MAADKLDLEKVKDFVTKQLKDLTEPKQVKFRALNKQIKREFGKSLFIPQLSDVVKSARPDLAKPARKAGKRRGRKPGPKPGRRPGRPPGSAASADGTFLVKVGRKLKLVNSRERVQAAVDKHLSAGGSFSKLKIYSLHMVTTKVVIE